MPADVVRLAFPVYLRWLIGEMIAPPRAFARQFGIPPRRVFKAAYWRSARSRQMLLNRPLTCGASPKTLGYARSGHGGCGRCWVSTGGYRGTAVNPIGVNRSSVWQGCQQ